MEDKVDITTEEIKSLSKVFKNLNDFEAKLDSAYFERYKTQDVELRKYIFTDSEILTYFLFAYYKSKFYKGNTEEDRILNIKLMDYLKEIVFEMYMIFEFDILDESPLYKEKPENEYERLYNFNKTQNMIIKTRIIWEKVMNFIYLAIEREELESKKSKKSKFKKWCQNNKYNFFIEVLDMFEEFDNKFRTPEIHKHSKLSSYFSTGRNNNISCYCLTILLKISNEVMMNIFCLFMDSTPNFHFWQKLSLKYPEKLETFEKMPSWLKIRQEKYFNQEDIDFFSGRLDE